MNKSMMMMLLFVVIASPSIQAQEVSRAQWVSGMKTALPTAFCNSSQYFRQCFDVTVSKCEEIAASSARVCLREFNDQIPQVLNQPQDGTAWGRKVGQCAGGAYEAALINKRISNEKCNNPAAWE